MPGLKKITPDHVTGYVQEVFDAYIHRRGSVPDLHQVLALRPEILKGRETLRNGTTDGATTLGRRREEMLNYFGAVMGKCTG